nr:hypothetical protein [Bacillus mycoides]
MPKVLKALKVRLVLLVPKVLKALKVRLVLYWRSRVLKGAQLKVLKVWLVLLALLDRRAHHSL